ncbi:low affinity iron permease family protein [Tsukamurella ocularis]
MPGSVDGRVSIFDRFADLTGRWVSQAWFFSFCVALVVIWAPSILILRDVDTWQLVINTATTIITFLLVALVQNQSTRADAAIQQKLNALIEATLDRAPESQSESVRRQLREAIGVERRESS